MAVVCRRGAALGVLAVALALGGCGRAGRLEAPPDPEHPFALGTDPQPGADQQGNALRSKSGMRRRPKSPPIVPPQQPFILDPLL